MTAICFHEAGHAVVLKHLLGRVPSSVRLADGDGGAQVGSGLGEPQSAREADRYAAYFAAGRAAVAAAKERGLLAVTIDPNEGYLGPVGSGADSDRIDLLQTNYRASSAEAHDLARRTIKAYWPAVEAIASALGVSGVLNKEELAAFLAAVPVAPR